MMAPSDPERKESSAETEEEEPEGIIEITGTELAELDEMDRARILKRVNIDPDEDEVVLISGDTVVTQSDVDKNTMRLHSGPKRGPFNTAKRVLEGFRG